MRTIVLFGCVLSALCAAGRVFYTRPGQSVVMECGVSGISNGLKWQRGHEALLTINGRFGMVSKGKSDMAMRSKLRENADLEVSLVKTEDAGLFTCTADRKRHEHRLLVVSVWADPSADLHPDDEAALRCQVHGLNPQPAVRWKGPNGRQIESHTVELKPVGSADAGTWECTFTTDGEPKTESLVVRVMEPAPPTTTPPHPKSPKDDVKTACPTCGDSTTSVTKSQLELSWWVWVAVGVGSLVVILLMISVIVMYKKTKRRKKKFLRMKHASQMKPKKYCQCQHQRPTAAAKPQQGRRREKPSALPLQPLLTQ